MNDRTEDKKSEKKSFNITQRETRLSALSAESRLIKPCKTPSQISSMEIWH